jgi:hypothetical protein
MKHEQKRKVEMGDFNAPLGWIPSAVWLGLGNRDRRRMARMEEAGGMDGGDRKNDEKRSGNWQWEENRRLKARRLANGTSGSPAQGNAEQQVGEGINGWM